MQRMRRHKTIYRILLCDVQVLFIAGQLPSSEYPCREACHDIQQRFLQFNGGPRCRICGKPSWKRIFSLVDDGVRDEAEALREVDANDISEEAISTGANFHAFESWDVGVELELCHLNPLKQ